MKQLTREQVITLNYNGSLLIVANKNIYDAQLFLDNNMHPGGNIFETIVERYATEGIDASKDYWFHTPSGRNIWDQYCVATINTGECGCILL